MEWNGTEQNEAKRNNLLFATLSSSADLYEFVAEKVPEEKRDLDALEAGLSHPRSRLWNLA